MCETLALAGFIVSHFTRMIEIWYMPVYSGECISEKAQRTAFATVLCNKQTEDHPCGRGRGHDTGEIDNFRWVAGEWEVETCFTTRCSVRSGQVRQTESDIGMQRPEAVGKGMRLKAHHRRKWGINLSTQNSTSSILNISVTTEYNFTKSISWAI